MSDLLGLKQKVKEGNDWRGNIVVEMDGEDYELTVRQLVDPELEEVMDLINRDELRELQDQLPEDIMEDMRELQSKDELDEEEEDKLEELRETLEEESIDLFDTFSQETMEGVRLAAQYAVVPDEQDLEDAFRNRASAIEEEYGIKVEKPEDCHDALKDEIQDMIQNSVNFVGFNIGIQALLAAADEQGN